MFGKLLVCVVLC